MKRLFVLVSVVIISVGLRAQASLPAVDKSPMDISYYPVDYPVLKIKEQTKDAPVARVVYSRPRRDGRTIFGGLVEYGKVWRLGANEATEIEFFRNVTIGGKKVPKGRYTLYAIVNENSWTFIINKETDTWGSFKYNASRDVARVDAPVQKLNDTVEYLAMTFDKAANGIKLVIAWENVQVALPINY